jgi:hypothetical protein
MSKKLGILLTVIGLGIGFISGALWNLSVHIPEHKNNAKHEKTGPGLGIIHEITQARISVGTLELLDAKKYDRIENLHLYLLDQNYDNLITQQSILNGQDADGSVKKKGYYDELNKLLVDVKKYESKLPSRNIPRKPDYKIEKDLADLLRDKKYSYPYYKNHLKKYLYRPWIGFKQFQSYISYESDELDPSPGPEIILFFHNDSLYAILHNEKIQYKSFVRLEKMSGYKVNYLYRLDKKLEKEFDNHYREIMINAD